MDYGSNIFYGLQSVIDVDHRVIWRDGTQWSNLWSSKFQSGMMMEDSTANIIQMSVTKVNTCSLSWALLWELWDVMWDDRFYCPPLLLSVIRWFISRLILSKMVKARFAKFCVYAICLQTKMACFCQFLIVIWSFLRKCAKLHNLPHIIWSHKYHRISLQVSHNKTQIPLPNRVVVIVTGYQALERSTLKTKINCQIHPQQACLLC